MQFCYHDGGRKKAGYRGEAGDCAVRAIAIATKKPYKEVYDALFKMSGESPRCGVCKDIIWTYMESIGWTWQPCMSIGSGCRVHLRADELPAGRLVVRVSKHVVAVVDGVIYDTTDPSQNGNRCVYGYYYKGGHNVFREKVS